MKYLAHRCDKCLRDAIVGLASPMMIGSSFPLGWVAITIEIGAAPVDAIKHITESMTKAAEASVSKSPADVLGAYIASAMPLVTGDHTAFGQPYRIELCEACAAALVCELGGISILEVARARRPPQIDAEYEGEK